MKTYIFILLIFYLASCSQERHAEDAQIDSLSNFEKTIPKYSKITDNEPTKHNLDSLKSKHSQFKINNLHFNQIIGEKGTRIVFPPKCFIDENGKNITDVKIKLIECFSLDAIIFNNLSTCTDTDLLQTNGMIKIEAYSYNDKKLYAEKDFFIEMISFNELPNLSVFQGKRSGETMNWIKQKEISKYLKLQPLETLDFYPRNSIYNKSSAQTNQDNTNLHCGLSRKLVSFLYNEEFKNTLISTKEFEERMQFIHLSCSEDLLKLYMENIDLNLWEIDKKASNLLKKQNNNLSKRFFSFRNQKKTKVKKPREKDVEFNKFLISKEKEYSAYKKKKELDLLITNSFYYSKLGWINLDRFLNDSNSVQVKVNLTITNKELLTESRAYLILENYNSIIPLKRLTPYSFALKLTNSSAIKLPSGSKIKLIAIAHDESKPYYSDTSFYVKNEQLVSMNLKNHNYKDIKSALSVYEKESANSKSFQRKTSCCEQPNVFKL